MTILSDAVSKTYKLKPSAIADADPDGDLLMRLLAVRGIEDAERGVFLEPDFETGLHDPFLLKDMDRTVERIIRAIGKGEHILVYSDYDADGLPGASVFHDFFKAISYSNVSFFQPDRHVDGFGVHAHLLGDTQATLMITIDCGISDVEPVRILSESGSLDVIVTDHHLPGPVLPAAYAIVNPKRADCEYPEKMLCGAAVAYKIVCALVSKMDGSAGVAGTVTFPSGYTKWLLDLVGIATMSDMVPLRGENRLLAYYGLLVLRKTRRPGIISLCRTNMLEPRNIMEDDIAFTIAPRINVASRLAHPKMAFDLLTSGSFDDAMRIAKDLNNINNRRKTMVAQIMKQAHAKVREMSTSGSASGESPVLVVGSPDWKPPVLGLVATQLIKAYGKPTFVWGRDDSGAYKGSARSTPEVDIVKLMYAVPAEVFINKGGHAQSGGFCVHPDHIFDFDAAMQKSYADTYGVPGDAIGSGSSSSGMCHEVDAILDVRDINVRTFSMIQKLAPYGVGNEKPLFAIKNFNIGSARLFGKTGEHLELEHVSAADGRDPSGHGSVKAIQFFFAEGGAAASGAADDSLAMLRQNSHKAIIGHIEKNQFRGASDIRIKIVDVI